MDKWILLFFGVGGLFWAFLAASRKRPQIVLHIKGHGDKSGLPRPLKTEVYFHCTIRNRSSERNSIEKLIFTIWNKRNTEYIWEAWNAEMYEYDKSTNNRGGSIDLPLVLDGKSGKECIVVLPMDEDVYFSYLADRMPPLNPTPNQEKPFQYKLILRDSHDNHFTGGLNTDKSVLVDYTSLRYMSVSNTNIQNAAMLGRPKLGLFFKLYIGRGLLWLRFRFKLLLYFLGISSST